MVDAGLPWTRWSVPIDAVSGLVALAVAYVTALRVLREPGDAIVPRRILGFMGGLLAMFIALTGPLGDLAGTFLFSAHMVQHLFLTLIAPPLLLYGTPGWMLRPLARVPAVFAVARVATRPGVALAVFSAVLSAWHVPLLYNAALEVRALHALMHVSFVVSAALGWWPIMSPLPELPRLALPLQMLYVLGLGAPMVVVAALITLAPTVLYPHYAAAPRLWGLDALADQRAGGAIMARLRHLHDSAEGISSARAWSFGLWAMIPAWAAALLGLVAVLVAA